jgi:hypothetical protein
MLSLISWWTGLARLTFRGGRAAAAAKGGEDDDDELARALALSMVPNVRHAPAAAAAATTAVDADALAQVEAMGFSRQRASEALRACNNAVDRAIARLLERS